MKYLALVTLILTGLFYNAPAQNVNDSAARAAAERVRVADSIKREQRAKDSILRESQRLADSTTKAIAARRQEIISNVQLALKQHPTLSFGKPSVIRTIEFRKRESNEGLFYFFVGLVLYIALMRVIFYKYISTMFTLFFRATLRQQQLREQLLQAPLPALLMNIFFVVSIATWLTLVMQHNGLNVTGNFWADLLYAILLIAGIYLVKYVFLNIVGWILGFSGVSDTYIFIVFLINKMIGIFILPFVALLAFPTPGLVPVVLMMSYILLGGMLFYRFMISYRPVRSEIKLSRLHFFIYLCAFEIAPLLLIYKVLLEFAGKSI